MRATLPAFVVLALNHEFPENEVFHLKDAGFENFKPLIGSYNGETERSYLLIVNTIDKFKAAMRLAEDNDQESILYVNQDREASLIPTNPEKPQEYIGHWKKFDGDASHLEAWTRDPETGDYYVCRK